MKQQVPGNLTITIYDVNKLTEHAKEQLCRAVHDYIRDILAVADEHATEVSGDMIDDAVAIMKLRTGGRKLRRPGWLKVIEAASGVVAFVAAMFAGVFAPLVIVRDTAVVGAIGFCISFVIGVVSAIATKLAGREIG